MNTDIEHTDEYTKEEVLLRQHFLRKKYPQPDVEQELAAFMNEHATNRHKHIKAFISIFSAAAILLLFILSKGTENKLDAPEGAVVAYTAHTKEENTSIMLQKNDAPPRPVGHNIKAATTQAVPGTHYTLTTPSGTTAEVTLSDGTIIWINANSKLQYPEHFDKGTREIALQGEAYFKVAHDAKRPFIVKTRSVVTKVLGTEFNVKSYKEDDTHVTLVEGSVQISSPLRQQNIHPGEDAAYNGKEFTVNEVDTERFTAWQKGEFYFDNETLLTIAQEIGSWYNVSVVFNNPDKMNTRLFFAAPKNGNIQEIISLINSLKKARISYQDGLMSID